jgi:uncharacterized protein
MADNPPPIRQPQQPEILSSSSPIPPEPPRFHMFVGPNGVRAGWRLLIALAIFLAAFFAFAALVQLARGAHARVTLPIYGGILLSELILFGAYLLASWIMSRIEERRMRDYGLGPSGAFGIGFWIAALVGFGSISLLLFALKLAGVYHLGLLALHGVASWKYAAIWGLAFLAVGFFEESSFRGYLLFTLTTGVGFWPAAILTSIAFGAVHHTNTGESMVGEFAAGGIGFFFCILIRKTGTLWPAIGFHAAWDWGETFFYGVPDSGLVSPGHLFTARFAGPVWLTGGSVGPEGSWFCLALILLLCILVSLLPGTKYPNPDAIPDPRRRRHEPAPVLFPEAGDQLPGSAS